MADKIRCKKDAKLLAHTTLCFMTERLKTTTLKRLELERESYHHQKQLTQCSSNSHHPLKPKRRLAVEGGGEGGNRIDLVCVHYI